MTPPEVIQEWGRLTGQTWRLVPHSVQYQAAEFCTAGFTLEEMRLVVEYTRRKVAKERDGFNVQSLTWRIMADDRWQKFQERLSDARKTKLGSAILLAGAKTVPPAPLSPTKPLTPAEEAKVKAEAKRLADDLAKRFRGGEPETSPRE